MREAYQMLESMTEHREKAFPGEGLSELQRRPSTLEYFVEQSLPTHIPGRVVLSKQDKNKC